MITLEMVAKNADVGIGTVSRYVNGEKVKPDTELKIRKAMISLGYKWVKSNCFDIKVGLIVPCENNLYLSKFIFLLRKKFMEYGWTLVVLDSNIVDNNGNIDNEKVEKKALELGLYGMLISAKMLTNENQKVVHMLNSIDISTIVVDEFNPTFDQCDIVFYNVAKSILSSVEYLAKMGHQKIALFCGHRRNDDKLVLIFKKSLLKLNLPVIENNILRFSDDYQKDVANFKECVKNKYRPTAIIVPNKELTYNLLFLTKDLNIKVPSDISIMGSENEIFDRYHGLDITCCKYSCQDFCNEICKLLDKRIWGDKEDFPKIVSLDGNIHEGQSVKKIEKSISML